MTREASGAEDREVTKLQRHCAQLEAQLEARGAELSLLRARFVRYETALRGSHVTVYTQDRNLRYTSLSDTMLGRNVDEILGRGDDEVLPPDSAGAVVALKREALASGEPRRTEIAITNGPDRRWHDLHIEPLRNEAGTIVGLTCASVDVTERKEGEAHLRLLMRELTHRSKNLLAVIQAMARQTARYSGSIDGFLGRFAARLQGLAASHDLLINEGWHGASLRELIRSQLATYFDGDQGPVAIEGPEIALKPEAAQNVGLALHELAINAEQFGALSIASGRVSVNWGADHPGEAVTLAWCEQFGPKVKTRRKRGFGSLVIERNLPRAIDAKVEMNFDVDGLRCHIEIPASQILSTR
jgi:PAS domain S-box-containing protein